MPGIECIVDRMPLCGILKETLCMTSSAEHTRNYAEYQQALREPSSLSSETKSQLEQWYGEGN